MRNALYILVFILTSFNVRSQSLSETGLPYIQNYTPNDYNAFDQNWSSAQDYLGIKYFTLEDGLSQVSSNDLLQDRSGFIWIATADGLNRFDGKEFKHFKYKESDTLSVSGNFINKLLDDNTGKIWVGTNGNGLNYYDQYMDVFHRVKLKHSESENEIISSLAVDENGIIWVASRTSGLHRLKLLEDGSFLQDNYFSNQAISSLLIDENNNLWVGCFTGQVFLINIDKEQILERKPVVSLEGNIQALHRTNNHMFIGSDVGFFIYDLQHNSIQSIELESNGNYLTKHVTSFLEAADSTVWIGTGNGLYLFDWIDNTVIKKIEYSDNDKGRASLSNNTIQSLLKISPNQMLVGTANYLNLIDFKAPYFKNISKDKKGNHLLNDNVIFSIFKDNKDLWIGTSDGGLNLIRNDKIYYFKADQNNATTISGNVVRTIVKDEKNKRLWLATTRGLSLIDLTTFNPNNPKFTVFHHNPDDPNSINMDFIKDIALDKNNNLWGATFGHGIFRIEVYNKNKINVFRYKNEKNNSNSIRNNVTQSICIDNKNNIWVGTQGGLTQLTFENNEYSNPKFTNYFKIANKEKTLSHNNVYDILIDRQERMWLGTRNGLNLFLGGNEFESWKEQSQFPNTIVYSIQDDLSENLWLGTNDGIVKFDIENKNFTNYNVEDNIQSKEFDIHARFRDANGIIYMGGIGGVTYFHPTDLKNIDNTVPLYFSQLRVKDKIIKPNKEADNLLKQSINSSHNLTFEYNQFPFYLKFSSIDFRLHKNIEYAYRLLPSDTEWNILKDPEIQFLNLPAGNYTLQVNGFSRGKEWEQPPLEMNINILSPWWSTSLAYTVYIGLLLTIFYWFYRFQLSKKLTLVESQRLKEVNQLKNSLYTNITHEFRTPITVILGMADILKENVKDKKFKDAKKSLEMISRNGKDLLHLVNEMMDLAKSESGNMALQLVQADVVPFVRYLSESFNSLAEVNQVNLTVYSEIEILNMDFDANKLTSIISNLLTNAIKFTPKLGKIIVHINKVIKKEKTYLSIKIKDNGIGISKGELANIFNRFYQTETSLSRKTKGTGIGLALTKELVDLMKGTIEVKSKLNKGSEFNIMIPVHTNALLSKNIEIDKAVQITIPKQQTIEGELSPKTNSDLPLILIIEDNMDVAYYLKTCLVNKYETLHAVNGIEGIEMAIEKIPDIIICDVMMPGKDGFEVCKTLKADERTDHIPIIILTAKVTTEDRLIGLSHGADAYLAKPFNKEELFIRLDQLVLLRKKLIEKIQKTGFTLFLSKRTKNPKIQFLQKAVKLIHEEIINSTFGSEELSSKLQLSDSQTYRKIKAITGKSTSVFIRSIRLQYAKGLLKSTDKTVSEIAYEVGFNDPSWFSRAFKEEFGFAPSSTS
jgi:signal transduction histidine kinase/ligand-binding sensor domain-containing protein/CheY-like chemotaxis protein